MAIAPLQIPQLGAISGGVDLSSPLIRLGEVYKQAQQRQSLADIGRGLSDGSLDYRTAAGRIAETGDIDSTYKFLQLAEARKKQEDELAASAQFRAGLAPMFGSASQPAAQPASTGVTPAMPAPAPPSRGVPPSQGTPVASTSRVYGYDEGVRDGIYDPPAKPGQLPPMQPMTYAQVAPTTAVSAGAGQPSAQAAPAPASPASQAAPAPVQPASQGAAPSGFEGIGIQHLPMLMQATSNPRLPAADRELAGKLMTRALDDAKAPDKIRTLRMLKEQSNYPGTILDLEKELRQSAKPEVNVNTKGETKFEEKLGEGQAKRFNDMIEAGVAAERKMVDINSMREISRRLGSMGASANIKEAIGPYAEALGINVDGLSDIQAYSSIVQRLAPQQRAPGSGSTSDIEFKGFLKSLPTLSQNPNAREITLNTMEALTRDEIERGRIASQLASGEIKRADAEKQLRALPDPMKAFTDWRKANPQEYGQALKAGASAIPQPQSQTRAPSASPSGSQQATPPVDGARQAPNGEWFIPDPQRPGKYLKVIQ